MTGTPDALVADPFNLDGAQRRKATLVVASKARDAADCGLLLAVLGLTPADGLPEADVPAQATEEPKFLGRRPSPAQPRRR
ncbi:MULTISPECIES: hypothetical protein [unclassified Amycolatopsis]|uniref:hypothetical protein n=1 Tax=unclassified Amycolatopsis TaxID=2618356 RepID=UPI002E1C922D|nr:MULTISPECIES: hypothetical protein [unclassified Amycolatopsis]